MSSTSKTWDDAMIFRYYSVLGRVSDESDIKEIARLLKVSEAEVQRESAKINNIGKKKKKVSK